MLTILPSLMGKTVVLFGAGASYDCVSYPQQLSTGEDLYRITPPLTKDLFLPVYLEKYMPSIPGASAIAAGYLNRPGNFEDYLSDWYARARSPETPKAGQDAIIRGLIQVMYYLGILFLNYSSSYMRTVSNYHDIVNILFSLQPDTTFITLNYDFFLERAIGHLGFTYDDMQSYVGKKAQVIKVHGSCDWHYTFPFGSNISMYQYLQESDGNQLIADLEGLSSGKVQKGHGYAHPDDSAKQTFHKYYTNLYRSIGDFYAPALAIPLNGQDFFKKKFICPQYHIDAMGKALDEADNLLIIGWSGNEAHLGEEFTRHFNGITKKVMICNGSIEESKKTEAVLRASMPHTRIMSAEGGFSWLLGDGYNKFVSWSGVL